MATTAPAPTSAPTSAAPSPPPTATQDATAPEGTTATAPDSGYTIVCSYTEDYTDIHEVAFTSLGAVWHHTAHHPDQPFDLCEATLSPGRKQLPGEKAALAVARTVGNGNTDADNLTIMLQVCAQIPPPDTEVGAAPEFVAGAAKLCPQAPHAAILRGDVFFDGDHAVSPTDPTAVKPGTYRGVKGARDCYWERSTPGGDTIDNDYITYAASGPVVTICSGDGGFSSTDCGPWKRIN